MTDRIRLAVVGGGRGAAFSNALEVLAEKLELYAVCDLNEAVLENWKKGYPGIAAYSSYEKLLDDAKVDAVLLATPLFYHARQATQALNAGKHVLSEVIASHTLEDSWELVEAVEKSGKTYMLSENYCFMQSNLMVDHMAHHGQFGEITYAECGYIHDVRTLFHYPDGSLTWRGQLARDFDGSTYPTHSLGPVAGWIGLGRKGGDELDSLVTFTSKSLAAADYFKEHYGADHPGANPTHWSLGDSATTLIRTKKGVLIVLKYDVQSNRPHNMTHYHLQGTKGSYLGSRHDLEEPIIWLKGRSPEHEWELLSKYRDEWEHPLWKKWLEEANKSGHGGGDFFVLEEFSSAIKEQRRPMIDVYDAVAWSSVFPLSVQSVAAGGKPVSCIDFKTKRQA